MSSEVLTRNMAMRRMIFMIRNKHFRPSEESAAFLRKYPDPKIPNIPKKDVNAKRDEGSRLKGASSKHKQPRSNYPSLLVRQQKPLEKFKGKEQKSAEDERLPFNFENVVFDTSRSCTEIPPGFRRTSETIKGQSEDSSGTQVHGSPQEEPTESPHSVSPGSADDFGAEPADTVENNEEQETSSAETNSAMKRTQFNEKTDNNPMEVSDEETSENDNQFILSDAD
jgi:hypothetical protein